MGKPGKDQELSEREALLKEREEAFEKRLKDFESKPPIRGMRPMGKDFDAVDPATGHPLYINEIGDGKGVELVTETDIIQTAEQEAFMNEPVKINVHADGTAGALDVICPTVNGLNQPIIRGVDQVVKRKYVEALARSRVTTYEQRVPNPQQPENIQMVPKVVLTYPFTVREDRNPRGAAWLDAIMRQPV